MAVILRFSPNSVDLGPITSKLLKIDLYSLRQECSTKNLVFSDISIMAILAEITENEHIIERHLRDIHPPFDYDASESQSTLLVCLYLGYEDHDFNIMQQSHGLFAIAKLLVRFPICCPVWKSERFQFD